MHWAQLEWPGKAVIVVVVCSVVGLTAIGLRII
jgi:hypothetical protein